MTMPLLTNTLPTIVGMGVVSRTTEHMFGKRKQQGNKRGKEEPTVARAKARRKLHTGKRGGRYYVRKGRKVYV